MQGAGSGRPREEQAASVRVGAPRFALQGGSLFVYALTLPLVVLGAEFGAGLLAPAARPRCPRYLPPTGHAALDTLTLWDGQWYLEIASRGYTYNRRGQSAVAFFPAYPALVRAVLQVAPVAPQWAGLFVSHGLLIAAYGLLVAYVRQRFPGGPPCLAGYALWALAVFPTGFFMRMAYSESLFQVLGLAAFLGMERRWPLAVLAAIAGAMTATRSVGVAMVVPLAMHVWERSGSWREAAGRLVWVGPLSVWGIAAYMAYQGWAFGDPLAFVKTQQFWRMRPPVPAGEMLLALASWEPIWSVYLPGAPGYWADIDAGLPLALSYHSANCVVFVGAIALLAAGGLKGWLSPRELVLGACLLAIPYVAAGYRFCMASQGRYVSVVFPIYLVLGQLLSRMPQAVSMGVLALLAGYLVWFSAMLAAGYFMV